MNKKRVWVLPYNSTSGSARELSRSLGVKRIRRKGSKWKSRFHKTIINWGTTQSNVPEQCEGHWNWINHPADVSDAADKLVCLQLLADAGIPTVPFTESKTQAALWIKEEDKEVYCRTKLRGHSGAGIVIANKVSELVRAKLYTQRLNARYEYRVHVAFGKVIEVRRKAKREGHEGNKYIRNHANGYVYRKHDIEVPDCLKDVSLEACEALSLDFCAVDVLLYKGDAYVLEVNTAPGLHGSTVDVYKKALKEVL